ncbi:MAG: metallophosphoesterase family protein, partial [Candidatus Thorarchaeota archaeon]
GNHEWYTSDWDVQDWDFSTYLDYVDFSDVVDEPGETELWYSFDWNDIHFIFLQTVYNWTGDVFTCPTAQMDWLEADLAANSLEFIVVSMHNPSYSIRAGRPDRWAQAASIRATFHDTFVDYGVDIVFGGHDHQYYRTVRDGINYVVTGGGGAPLYGIQTEGTVWQTGDVGFSDYHYCVGTLESGILTIEVILMNGTVADSFEFDYKFHSIDSPTDIEYEEGTTGHSIVWNPSDPNPDRFELFRDDTLLDSGTWDGSAITVSVDGLSVGTYNYTIVVYDTSDHSIGDTVIVEVTEAPPPEPPLPMELIVISMAAVVTVIIIVIVFRKRE